MNVDNALADAERRRATNNQGVEALEIKFADLARLASKQEGGTHKTYNKKVGGAVPRRVFVYCGYEPSVPGDEEEPLTPEAAAWKVKRAVYVDRIVATRLHDVQPQRRPCKTLEYARVCRQ